MSKRILMKITKRFCSNTFLSDFSTYLLGYLAQHSPLLITTLAKVNFGKIIFYLVLRKTITKFNPTLSDSFGGINPNESEHTHICIRLFICLLIQYKINIKFINYQRKLEIFSELIITHNSISFQSN